MARRKSKPKKPDRRRTAPRVGANKSARRIVRRAKARSLFQEFEPVLVAAVGAIGASVVAQKLPVAKSPNGEKLKLAAAAAICTYASAKTKNPMLKSALGGAAVGATVGLARQLMPTLLAGDDLLGYVEPIGNVDEARVYAGLGMINNLAGDDLLGDDLLGDDLLGDGLSSQGVHW